MGNWTRLSAVFASFTCALLLGVAPAYATYGKLTVVKSLTPSSDSGRFNLFIKNSSGTTQASVSAVGDGGSVSKTVLYGTYQVQETAASGSSLADYDASIVCKKSSGATVASGSGSGPLSVYVAVGDDITCTISNKRKPYVRVVKRLVPASDSGRFDLQVDGATKTGAAGVGDGGDTGFVQVAPGSHTVGELAHSGTSLANYRSSMACDSGKGGENPGTSHKFSVAYGDKVTCTITNTAVPPQVAIDKTGPTLAHDGDKLTYTISVTNPGTSTLRDVTVTDAIQGQAHGCDAGGGPTLTGGDTNGDGRLQTTETWTYTCVYTVRHSDENGQSQVVNVATVTAADDSGHTAGPKTDTAVTQVIHPIETPPTQPSTPTGETTPNQPQQLVLPERVTPGSPRLTGASGCTSQAFYARIRGTKVASVKFMLDGKVIKRFTNPSAKTLLRVRIEPQKLRIGVHRLVVNVTFTAGSGTKPRTLRLSFQRCVRALRAPRFTG